MASPLIISVNFSSWVCVRMSSGESTLMKWSWASSVCTVDGMCAYACLIKLSMSFSQGPQWLTHMFLSAVHLRPQHCPKRRLSALVNAPKSSLSLGSKSSRQSGAPSIKQRVSWRAFCSSDQAFALANHSNWAWKASQYTLPAYLGVYASRLL